MFQNIEFYRSRGPRFFSSLGQRKLCLQNLFPKLLRNIQKERSIWTKGSFPFINFVLIVSGQNRCAFICVNKGKYSLHIYSVLKDIFSRKVIFEKQCF